MIDKQYINSVIKHLSSKNIEFKPGLSQTQIEAIQKQFEIIFPPDLKFFLSYAVPVGKNFPDWYSIKSTELLEIIRWPLKGILFDIQHDQFWPEDWGVKPTLLDEALMVAKTEISKVPPLIPIYAHRFIPSEPSLEGNPILSVYQTDIVYYGHDLPSYFSNEFGVPNPYVEAESYRVIRFWTDIIER